MSNLTLTFGSLGTYHGHEANVKIVECRMNSLYKYASGHGQIATPLKNHYDPRPSEIMQQFHFISRVHKWGESVANYLAELRALAQYCNFGGMFEDMSHDRLVIGINDLVLQRCLLAESRLTLKTLKKATEIALAHKTSVKDSNVIQGASAILGVVNQVTPTRHQSAKPCCCCG